MSELSDSLQQALSPGYTLERELTGGGMSRVFVATDVTLGRKVVVKVLPPELAAGVNHERFRREIQVAAQLQHPHIVPLLSAGEQGALIWYTMPFINGSSLREALVRGEKFAVKDVVRIMRDVAEALDYAHGLGVIHRDIKPGNVLLMGTHALVTDFGVSKAISASMPASGYTSAGMAIGTPAYMAPEQLAADPAADHRMDLYALGLLGYELLTGTAPFKEDSPQKTMAAQLTRDPRPLEESRADVPAALSALVRRLLSKLPDDRPARAADVVTTLDDIALSSGGQLAPLSAMKKPSAVRTTLVAGVALAIVAAAWAMGQRTGEVTVGAFVRDSILAAESSQVVAPAAAMLTREDSMAIAKAVSSRLAERPAPARQASGRPSDSVSIVAFADSIRAQIQRVVLDSLVQLEARRMRVVRDGAVGSAMGMSAEALTAVASATEAEARMGVSPAPTVRTSEPRRVVVAMPRPSRNRPDLDAIAASLADSLRVHLDRHPRFVVIAADSVSAVLRESRTINTVQEKLKADLFVSISLIPTKDSVVRMVQLRDLSAAQGFNYRAFTSTGSASEPTAGISTMMPTVVRSLVEMERGFRGRPPSAPRPAPTTEGPPRRP